MTNDRKKLADWLKEQPVTYEVYAAMPDDGNRYEIIDGLLEMMPPGPNTVHQSIGGELLYLLKSTCKTDFMNFSAPLDVILSATDVRQPDIAMVHRSRMSIVTKRGIEGPPDLVVEILSPGSRKRDKVGKMATYEKYKVPEYWIVDPNARTLEQYVLRGGRLELRDVFEDDDAVASDRLPCVTFRVIDVFRDIPDLQ